MAHRIFGRTAHTAPIVLRRPILLGLPIVLGLGTIAGCGGDDPAPPATAESISTLAATAEAPAPASVPASSTSSVAMTPSTQAAPAATAPPRPIRIMPLGDSLTQGTDPVDPSRPQSYRGYLAQRLAIANYDVDFVGSDQTPTAFGADPDNEGHGGFTIGPDDAKFCGTCEPANLAAHVAGWVGATSPDVILLLAGANDLLPEPEPNAQGGVRPVSPADAPAKLQQLVATLSAAAPGVTVLVASQPPMPFAAGNPTVEAGYAALNRGAAAIPATSAGAVYVPLFEQLDAGWVDDVDSLADGLHPSASGAAKMADVWFAALQPVLDARRGR